MFASIAQFVASRNIVDGYPKAETSIYLSPHQIGVAMLFEVA